MENDLDPLNLMPKPTPNRPLLGLTILIVEDSRYSCEAMRFMALRSGANCRPRCRLRLLLMLVCLMALGWI